MKEKYGLWYALEAFDTYKYRAKFVVEDKKGKQLINTEIYTTNESRTSVEQVLVEATFKKYDEKDIYSARVVHWVSKEQDDHTAKFLDEILNF